MDYINLEEHPLPITLSDKALGRHQQTIKKQVNNVIIKMSWEERDKKETGKMDEMENDELATLISVMPNLACKKSPSKPD